MGVALSLRQQAKAADILLAGRRLRCTVLLLLEAGTQTLSAVVMQGGWMVIKKE